MAAIAAMALLFACDGPLDAATASLVIVGEWEKPEQTLPPMNLVVSRHSDGDQARLRLSGVERFGTVTLNGSHVVLHFAGTADITGEILSRTELRLDFPPSAPINLRKRAS